MKRVNKAEKTILDIQSEIEAALQRLPGLAAQLPDVLRPLVRLAPPKGARAQVSLRRASTDRQVKRTAPADSWSPDSGLVSISYGAAPANEAEASDTHVGEMAQASALPPRRRAKDPAHELVLALASAENDPQHRFVALKWFRDTYLPQKSYAWAATPENRHSVLKNAIERNLILTSRVPNPKNPQFPVTAIRLNRPLAEVREILDREPGSASAFAPITISGEPLSETVLRERR